MCTGLQSDDGTKMTLIGGLMYNGGPGANTSMHGLAAMVPKLRAKAGSYARASLSVLLKCHPGAEITRVQLCPRYGLVYANGGLMTKHSVGIYSTTPYSETHSTPWAREDPHVTQAVIDAVPEYPVATEPQGRGQVETYTVMHAGWDSCPPSQLPFLLLPRL